MKVWTSAIAALVMGVSLFSVASADEGSNSFIAEISAYCHTGYTRSGAWTEPGMVAVDPSVIPLGSRITIEGLPGTFLASDTGGGVIGAWVDIYMSSCADAIQWGRQRRLVEIVE